MLPRKQLKVHTIQFPGPKQEEIRPLIKKKLLFHLYRILQHFSHKRSSVSHQERAVFVYLVKRHQLDFLYPVAAKMSYVPSKRKKDVMTSSDQEANIFETDEDEEDSLDIMSSQGKLLKELAKQSREVSFQQIAGEQSPIVAVDPAIKIERNPTIENNHDYLQLVGSGNSFRFEGEERYDQFHSSHKDISASSIVNPTAKRSDYQFLSSNSIQKQFSNASGSLFNAPSIGHGTTKKLIDSNQFSRDYVRSDKESVMESNNRESKQASRGKNSQQNSNVLATPSKQERANSTNPQLASGDFLSQVRATNSIQQGPTDHARLSIDDSLDHPQQSQYQLQTPSQRNAVLNSSGFYKQYGSGQISSQQLSKPSSSNTQFENNPNDEQQPSSFHYNKELRSRLSQGLVIQVKVNNDNTNSIDQSEYQQSQLVSPTSYQASNKNIKIEEQDDEDSPVRTKKRTPQKIGTETLQPAQQRQRDQRREPNQQKKPSEQNVENNEPRESRNNLSQKNSKLLKGLSQISGAANESSSRTIQVPQNARNTPKNQSSTNDNQVSQARLPKTNFKPADHEKKKSNEFSKGHDRNKSQLNLSKSQTSDDVEDDPKRLGQPKKQTTLKVPNVPSQLRRDSTLSTKKADKSLMGSREASAVQASKNEMDFLRQLQKQEAEKDLLARFDSRRATNLVDKRNMINELINTLESEKVPEVKYQIYLYRERMSQIRNQQNQIHEAIDNQLAALPDCYEYLSTVVEPKFRNKFRKEDGINLRFSENIKLHNQKNQAQGGANHNQSDQSELVYQSYNQQDRSNDKEMEAKRRIAFQEQTEFLRIYKRDLEQLDQEMKVIQSKLDEAKQSERTRFNQPLELDKAPSSHGNTEKPDPFSKKLMKSQNAIKRLKRGQLTELEIKFRKVQAIASYKNALADEWQSAIKITL